MYQRLAKFQIKQIILSNVEKIEENHNILLLDDPKEIILPIL